MSRLNSDSAEWLNVGTVIQRPAKCLCTLDDQQNSQQKPNNKRNLKFPSPGAVQSAAFGIICALQEGKGSLLSFSAGEIL